MRGHGRRRWTAGVSQRTQGERDTKGGRGGGGGDSGTDPEAADQNHRTRLRDPQVSPRRPVRGKRARDQSEVESGDSDARECDPG